MRPFVSTLLVLLVLFVLSGCQIAGAIAGGEAASVTVFGRGIADLGVSAVTGRDCSIVRLDQGRNYCAPRESLPPPPPFCTKTLGVVDCWADPDGFIVLPHRLADAPPLTPEQVRDVAARWPKALNLFD